MNGNELEYLKFVRNIFNTERNYDHKCSSMEGKLPQPNVCINRNACSSNLSTTCQFPYKGFLCTGCSNGYHRGNGYICNPCPNQKQRIIYLSISITLLLCCIIIVILLAVRKTGRGQGQTNRILSKIKICVNYYYISSKIFDVLSFVTWPRLIITFKNFLKVMEFNPLTLLAIKCWMPEYSLFDNFVSMVLINGCISAITVFCLSLWTFIAGIGLVEAANVQKLRKALISIAFLLLFLLYPPLSSNKCVYYSNSSSCMQEILHDFSKQRWSVLLYGRPYS